MRRGEAALCIVLHGVLSLLASFSCCSFSLSWLSAFSYETFSLLLDPFHLFNIHLFFLSSAARDRRSARRFDPCGSVRQYSCCRPAIKSSKPSTLVPSPPPCIIYQLLTSFSLSIYLFACLLYVYVYLYLSTLVVICRVSSAFFLSFLACLFFSFALVHFFFSLRQFVEKKELGDWLMDALSRSLGESFSLSQSFSHRGREEGRKGAYRRTSVGLCSDLSSSSWPKLPFCFTLS